MGLVLQIQSTAAVATGFGSLTVGPITVTGSNTPTIVNTTLTSGANTITVPSGAVACVITPPSGNGVALTLKGVTGDTGVHISQTTPSLIVFDGSNLPSTFVITAASLTTGSTQILFL